MSSQPKAKNRGFTLIELMIVVAIIGIMAAICIPSYIRFQCHAKQSEAREILKAIWLTEEAYSGEYGGFLNIADLTSYGGLDPKTFNTKYYGFTSTVSSGTDYSIDARDTVQQVSNSGTVDQWSIDELDARPLNVVDRCATQ